MSKFQESKTNPSPETSVLGKRRKPVASDEYVAGKIMEYNLDPYDFTDEVLIDYAVDIFKHYHLMKQFNIQENAFKHFMNSVKRHYHLSNKYHNFKHVWSVMHLSFQILLNGADKYLEPLNILCVFISALCHDLGHRGTSNAFEVATSSNLSKLYFPDQCVLERHHADTAQQLLVSAERKQHNDILQGLDATEKEKFYIQLGYNIMGTEMGKHSELLNELLSFCPSNVAEQESSERFFADESNHRSVQAELSVSIDTQDSDPPSLKSSKKSPLRPDSTTTTQGNKSTKSFTPRQQTSSKQETQEKQRRIYCPTLTKSEQDLNNPRCALARIIVHAADIGAQTQHSPLAFSWANRVYSEFESQAKKERKLGIVTAPFLHDLQEDHKKIASQHDFIVQTVKPLWAALCKIFPKLTFAFETLKTNEQIYEKQYQEMIQSKSTISPASSVGSVVTTRSTLPSGSASSTSIGLGSNGENGVKTGLAVVTEEDNEQEHDVGIYLDDVKSTSSSAPSSASRAVKTITSK